MKTKILTLITIFFVASLTTSFSYACQTINPQPQCLNIEFVAVSVQDNEQIHNTATIKAQITPDHNTINVKITNAYPNYQAAIKYTIKNTGNRAVQFYAPTISNPAPWALEVTSTNHRGTFCSRETPYRAQQQCMFLWLPKKIVNTVLK